jgi:hypothetical protein
MMEIVTRLRIAPFGGRPYSGLLLLPARLTGPQLEIVGLVGRSDTSMFLHGSRAAIRVAELYVTSALSGDVARPHPSLGAFFASLGSALGAKTSPRRRIYVARRDSANRVLINEDAVIALLSSRGFEIVELVGMTLADQARLFAGSSHIVAPHGAGLTNLVFCAPGVSVCELHMDKYLNWCFRRLCGLRGLNYGCVVGTADGDLRPDGDPHHLRWQIDIDSLDAVLSDVRFRRSGPPLA